jgi:hypothetical protein
MEIDIPDEAIVCSLAIKADNELTEEQIDRFLSAFAVAAVSAGLEQATTVDRNVYLGVAW